ncbi:5-methyltetrahydropteroyltriglutamate--homocysteine methyltransferase [Kushneria avicenniae]|uniref:5-methyltetrahydropteroyltriglutamate--homocysteine methyltransferase n=1 Tax=Kushneria avicenniae TaxID=402385 RepID=A0A1I1GIQ7_9GAMM|nr:5-methyltetrahydropteroyltriglutamate--homocysteine S-methyltransferase [Kushneria avicenniae]SFC11659.1 5-methyltetrahydropteroyltriglutamate--homocysteine methyltransferase [Kushneria avicenniae]
MSLPMPPYRADTVGSLLRSDRIKSAREQLVQGTIDHASLKAVEDEEITRLVRKQESLGLKAVTDGELRRAWWHFDFLEHLTGVEGFESEQGIQFQGRQTPSHGVRVVDRVRFNPDHPMLEHFRYLNEQTTSSIAKMTIPSPSVLHFRGAGQVDRSVYPEWGSYFNDLADTWREAIAAFYAAGCRYLQLDDTVWAYLCSDSEIEAARERGIESPEKLQYVYADVLNRALEDRPADMHISLHVCRGNFRSTWISEGGYEPVAKTLLGSVNVDAFFLEYDTDRAGDFRPLRFLPRGTQQVVLGLVTTKTGELESAEQIQARLNEASEYVPMDQICLSPQCGFASTHEGNNLSEEQQWEKLDLIVNLAEEFWGY